MMWLVGVLGCNGPEGDDVPSLGGPSGCDPLVPEVCALPWPSSLFEVDDATTETGKRLHFADHTFPVNRDGVPFRPDMLHHKDGFSTLGPILVWFEGLSTEGLIGHQDLDAYLAADARTVIVDTVTHERVPHFAELDATTDKDGERVLFLRPVVPLEHGRRYVVGLRGLVRTDGAPVAPSDAFVALRDGTPTTDPDVESRRDRFDSLVFPELEGQGFSRDELQLAWDFGTISRDSSLGPVLAARDDALARVGSSPPFEITSVEDEDCQAEGVHIARTLYGTFTSPRYTDLDTAGARLVRDEAGLPLYQGDTRVEFMVRVPCSLAADPGSGGQVLQYGHGLLGDFGEARSSYLAELADTNRWVLVAQNWTGMSGEDAPFITLMMALDVSDFEVIPDRTTQGLSEWVVGARLATGALGAAPELQFGGRSVIDSSLPPIYYGNSQGAILGGAYLALSPVIERGVLGVGGAPYSLLLARSVDFGPFFLIFQQKFVDHRDIALLLAAFQTVWDPGEAGGYAHALTRDPLPGTPPKRVLLQVAVGDAQVSTLGAHILARSYGAVSVGPAVRPIWGVPEQTAPIEGSALVEWLYTDGSTEPVENLPPSADGDTHECPRREPEAQLQLSTFLKTGIVEQHCDGPCISQRAGLCD
jgi:hypothetical protein